METDAGQKAGGRKSGSSEQKISPIHVGAKRFPVSITFLDEIIESGSVQRPRSLAEGIARIERGQDPFEVDPREQVPIPQFFSRNALKAAQRLHKLADSAESGRGGLDEVNLSPSEEQGRLKLAVHLAAQVCRPGETVLVFLSGLADIMACCELAEDESVVPGHLQRTLDVIPMHSLLPQEEQDRAFTQDGKPSTPNARAVKGDESDSESESDGYRASEDEEAADLPPSPPVRASSVGDSAGHDVEEEDFAQLDRASIRRIVFATNIAESSITIPDVTTVIDLGCHKEMRYDAKLGAAVLKPCFVSKASATQRSGRAGRLGPGKCFRLYPQRFFDLVMPDFDQPEMLRLPLDSTVLRCRAMGLQGKGDKLLSDAPQPPAPGSVPQAEGRLLSMGLLEAPSEDAEPRVTPLGQMLSTFPGDARLGVFVSLATALGNPVEAVLLAASATVSDVFVIPNVKRSSSPSEFCELFLRVSGSRVALDAGSMSDAFVARGAYLAWRKVHPKLRSGWASARGLMHRRLQHMHSFVVECSRRVLEQLEAGDAPRGGGRGRGRGRGRDRGAGAADRRHPGPRVSASSRRLREAIDALSKHGGKADAYESLLSNDIDTLRVIMDATMGVSQKMLAQPSGFPKHVADLLPAVIGR